MLEFNIDKQAGIQLHTCQRKSRWCKTLLLLSWLLLLPLLLGWLFWEGFLSFDNNIIRDANNEVNNKTQSVISSEETPRDCSNAVATSLEESKANCDQQLVHLKNELLEEIKQIKSQAKNQALNSQTKDSNAKDAEKELNQQLADVNQKLKMAQKALRHSEQELKTEQKLKNNKLSSPQRVADKNLDKKRDKKLYFYEKILDVSSNKNEIAIEYFAVKAQDKKRHYRFQLLLTKLGKHQITTGSYDIFIKGNKTSEVKNSDRVSNSGDKSASNTDKKSIKKQSVTYKHTGLMSAENNTTDNTFSFEYYQDLQGDIVLPENFEVESFSVNINPKNLSTVRNSYEWKAVKNQPFKEVL